MNNRSVHEELKIRIAELEKEIETLKKTEVLLRNNEETFYQFFENRNESLILRNFPGGDIIYAGSSYRRIFGQQIEQLLKNPFAFLTVIHPEDRQSVENAFRHMNIRFETEFRVLHSDGGMRRIHFKSIPIRDAYGVICRIACVAEDITARKQKEEEIEASKNALSVFSDRLRHILDSISDGFYSLDNHLNITYFNRAAEKILGRFQESVIGKNLLEVFPEAKGSVFEEKFKTAVRERIHIAFETFFKIPPFENWYLMNIYPFEEGITVFFQVTTEKKQALEALVKSEYRYQEILNRAPAVIYVKDIHGRYTFINRHFEMLSGYRREQVIGRSDFDLFPEEVVRNSKANDQKVLDTGAPVSTEESGPVDGEMHTFITMKFPVFDAEGRAGEICGISTDINDRKLAEEALKQSGRRLNEAQRVAHIGSFDRNLKTGEVWISDELFRIWGYEPGCPLPELGQHVHPEDRQKFSDTFYKVMNCQPRNELEYRIIRNDGSERILYSVAYTGLSETGAPLRFYGTTQDITERKLVEYELHKTRNYLFQILNSSPSAIIGIGSDGVITLFNAAAEQLFNITASEAIEKVFDKAIPEYAILKNDICKVIKTKQIIIKEKIAGKIGERHYFHSVYIYPLTAKDIQGVVMRIDDVTEKVRLEEIMIQTEKMMSVGGLAAGMAHEINNPLSGILQSAQNILRRISPDLGQNIKIASECGADLEAIRSYMKKRGIIAFLEGIRISGKKAADIVANMLSFSRRSESQMAPSDLSDLIKKTIELASHDYDLKRNYDFRLIRIIRDFADDLPLIPCVVTEIEQVILNLLRNSAQAMIRQDEKKPQIILRLRKEPDMARIEVEDNGPGMDEIIRKRVFEPFFTTKSVGVGTGLGLSVSYFIITHNHKGTITVTSEPGKGACFIIRLPMQRP